MTKSSVMGKSFFFSFLGGLGGGGSWMEGESCIGLELAKGFVITEIIL